MLGTSCRHAAELELVLIGRGRFLESRFLTCYTLLVWSLLLALFKPAQMSHELHVRHVSQLLVVLQYLFDRLAFLWRGQPELSVMLVLELDYLVHSGRRWSCRRARVCGIIRLVGLIGVEFKLGLLPLFVLLSIGV